MAITKRDNSIDIARGIAIICIVLGHLGNPTINRFVYTFHVPIFYLISGYFFREEKLQNSIRRRAKSLLLPYAVTSVIIVTLMAIRVILTHGNVKETIITWGLAAVYGSGSNLNKNLFGIRYIGAIWFLWSSFWGGIWLNLLLRLKMWIRVLAVGLIFAFFSLSSKIVWLPFGLSASGSALIYIYIGYLLKEDRTQLRGLSRETIVTYFGLAFCVWVAFIIHFEGFYLVWNNYGRGVIDIIGTIMASTCVWLISWKLNRWNNSITKMLSFLGQNSIVVLCMHIIEQDTIPFRSLIGKIGIETKSGIGLIALISVKFTWIMFWTVIITHNNMARKMFGLKSKA